MWYYLSVTEINMRVWRNWQTRKIQVLIVARLCKFNSCHPHQKKDLQCRSFFNSIRLRRVILLRSYIRLTPSDIALRAVIRRIEYHCSEGAISLCGIAAKYHISRKRDIDMIPVEQTLEKTKIQELRYGDHIRLKSAGFFYFKKRKEQINAV